jgi:hypothetical protein
VAEKRRDVDTAQNMASDLADIGVAIIVIVAIKECAGAFEN